MDQTRARASKRGNRARCELHSPRPLIICLHRARLVSEFHSKFTVFSRRPRLSDSRRRCLLAFFFNIQCQRVSHLVVIGVSIRNIKCEYRIARRHQQYTFSIISRSCCFTCCASSKGDKNDVHGARSIVSKCVCGSCVCAFQYRNRE